LRVIAKPIYPNKPLQQQINLNANPKASNMLLANKKAKSKLSMKFYFSLMYFPHIIEYRFNFQAGYNLSLVIDGGVEIAASIQD